MPPTTPPAMAPVFVSPVATVVAFADSDGCVASAADVDNAGVELEVGDAELVVDEMDSVVSGLSATSRIQVSML